MVTAGARRAGARRLREVEATRDRAGPRERGSPGPRVPPFRPGRGWGRRRKRIPKQDRAEAQSSQAAASGGHRGDPRRLYLGLQIPGAPVKIWQGHPAPPPPCTTALRAPCHCEGYLSSHTPPRWPENVGLEIRLWQMVLLPPPNVSMHQRP
ncbi:uncharacterized protein LOC130541472 [Pan paniscus]|uniref:uncharacterized protein LOC130541472 n=1 Tax=Pan paniscus TaxID=9597 RepID=UPI0004F097EC|nr:uncharacterized protein LOC130541472 [Pan paniscus]